MDFSREDTLKQKTFSILLADDDLADRLLFEESLAELPVSSDLTTVQNGEELINWLNQNVDNLPDVLYLDLQMPRKNGLAALAEIKRELSLQDLPVFIITTNKSEEMIKRAYKDAAHYCIYKPNRFADLKSLIYKSLMLVAKNDLSLPNREDFILSIQERNDQEIDRNGGQVEKKD